MTFATKQLPDEKCTHYVSPSGSPKLQYSTLIMISSV